MRNRFPVRLVDADRRTPSPITPPAPAAQPVTAVELAVAGDALVRASMELIRAIERRDFDHIGPESSPELQAVLAARRAWVRTATRWEMHA